MADERLAEKHLPDDTRLGMMELASLVITVAAGMLLGVIFSPPGRAPGNPMYGANDRAHFVTIRTLAEYDTDAIDEVMGAVAGVAAVHAVTAINLKHRVPFELVLAIFAAETITRGIAAVRG